NDAIHGVVEVEPRGRGWCSARRKATGRDGRVQRRALETWGDARGRGVAGELQGSARELLEREAQGDRRSLRGSQGADCRVLDHSSQDEGRSGGLAREGAIP